MINMGGEKQVAVVVVKFNKEDAADAVQVVEEDIPIPKPGASIEAAQFIADDFWAVTVWRGGA